MKTMYEKSIVVYVGMAEMVTTNDPNKILCSSGLGSCIGLVMYDAVAKCSGLVHIVLPDSSQCRDNSKPGKFADTAISVLLNSMKALGSEKYNLVIKAAGGAKMFSTIKSKANYFNIGERNFDAVEEHLKKHGLKLKAYDVSGNEGRTLKLVCRNGTVTVKKVNKIEFIL